MSKNWRGLLCLTLSLILTLPCQAQGVGDSAGTEAFLPAKQKWVSEATAAAKAKWKQPQRTSSLKAVVRMDVGQDGRISNISVVQASGDSAFDFSAVNACLGASPVTAPPAGSSKTELVITFDSNPAAPGTAGLVQTTQPEAPGLVAPPSPEEIPGLLKSQRYPEALERLKGAFSQQGPEARLYMLRGAANLGLGNVDDALNDYNQAAVIDTQSAIALAGRGACYRAQRKSEQAITDFTNALALVSNPSSLANAQLAGDDDRILLTAVRKGLAWPFPDLRTALFALRGTCYFYLKQYDKAMTDFNTCITAHPNLGQAYHARGLTYLDMNQKDKAEADFAKAIQLDDKSAKFYEARGKLYESYGNHDKALADLNRAVALDSQCAGCYWNRGLVYESMGDPNSASRDMQRAMTLGYKPPIEKQKAKLIVHMRSVQMAAEAYAVTHEGRYPTDIDESFKEVLRAGGGDIKSQWPRVNPISYRAEMPILGMVRDVASARAAQPSRMPPGVVEYSPIANGANYAIRGGDARGMALPGEGGMGGTMVLSSDN